MKHNYFKILKSLVQIPSFSGNEGELAEHIVNVCNDERWVAKRDGVHNVHIYPKGSNCSERLPLLYAHLDTHTNGSRSDMQLRADNIIELDVNGQVQKSANIQIGFDDKSGVAAIIYLMKHTSLKFRALLVVQEEQSVLPVAYNRCGGGGVEYVLRNTFNWFFENSTFVISLDRANSHDIIDEYGGNRRPRMRMCTREFSQMIVDTSIVVGYPMNIANSPNVADIYNIRRAHPNLNCVNLSIGYYNEHLDNESLNIDETLGVIKVVMKILEQNN